MASIIPGYEYDIFISYRQKDNKGDRWVNEFVNSLRTELEATFKEDISIYFDENPHDRLQDTYNVNKSLEGKLKCLIFIPILSQTYCDPNCYAWQYEFLIFNNLARQDQFGKDIKLKNGNVASRILPIRIHDLDKEDVTLFEIETGSVLRAIDFVFKTASGVNRPIRTIEDHPNDNLNKTIYRDQINKVANAVKEIILGMKTVTVAEVKEKPYHLETPKKLGKAAIETDQKRLPDLRKRLKLAASVLIGLVIIVFLVYPLFFPSGKSKIQKDANGKISIAINTFQNLTGDTSLNYMQIGLPNILRGYLANSNDLSVQSTSTMNEVYQSMQLVNYASVGPSVSREAAIKLKAGTYLTGSFQKIRNKTMIQIDLNDTQSGTLLMSDTVEGILPDDYKTISASLSQKLKNYLEIKAIRNNSSSEFRDAYTNSADAYRKYIDGMQLMEKRDGQSAIQSFQEAFKIDSTFSLAAFYASYNYYYSNDFVMSAKWIAIANRRKEFLPNEYQYLIDLWVACLITKDYDAILKYCNLLSMSDIKSRFLWVDLGGTFCSLEKYDKAIEAFKKVESLNAEWGEEWRDQVYYYYFGLSYHMAGMHDKEATIYEKGLKLFPDQKDLIYNQAICAITKGDTSRATELLNICLKKSREAGLSESDIEGGLLGDFYRETNSLDKAERHYRNALRLDPKNNIRMAYMALFLIQNNRNIDEAEKLALTVLKNSPQNPLGLWAQGLVYHRHGKFEDALKFLNLANEKMLTYNTTLSSDIKKVKEDLSRQN